LIFRRARTAADVRVGGPKFEVAVIRGGAVDIVFQAEAGWRLRRRWTGEQGDGEPIQAKRIFHGDTS
jgi:hypothetical protein